MFVATGEMETLNAMASEYRLVPMYNSADDESEDDEIVLHTLTNQDTGVGIQIGGWQSFMAYDFYEQTDNGNSCMWFGKEQSSIIIAMADALTRYREKGKGK